MCAECQNPGHIEVQVQSRGLGRLGPRSNEPLSLSLLYLIQVFIASISSVRRGTSCATASEQLNEREALWTHRAQWTRRAQLREAYNALRWNFVMLNAHGEVGAFLGNKRTLRHEVSRSRIAGTS
ncbi:hypothetical protein NDU88_003374 [Pleurodeles waltl]|uniref:Uncharacterized protein n=1 Tax=Pleurodeles waltl TaxID=8319 RepID=A0AAV7V1K3_PLEWA|nr:hypothetical protein NDU88_003374 [Pleurodeles waltl]